MIVKVKSENNILPNKGYLSNKYSIQHFKKLKYL